MQQCQCKRKVLVARAERDFQNGMPDTGYDASARKAFRKIAFSNVVQT